MPATVPHTKQKNQAANDSIGCISTLYTVVNNGPDKLHQHIMNNMTIYLPKTNSMQYASEYWIVTPD